MPDGVRQAERRRRGAGHARRREGAVGPGRPRRRGSRPRNWRARSSPAFCTATEPAGVPALVRRPSSSGRRPRRRRAGGAAGEPGRGVAGMSRRSPTCRRRRPSAPGLARARRACWPSATSSRCASAAPASRASSSWAWCWPWRPPGTTATWCRRRPTASAPAVATATATSSSPTRPIDYPELQSADLLVTLSQDAADGYAALLRPDEHSSSTTRRERDRAAARSRARASAYRSLGWRWKRPDEVETTPNVLTLGRGGGHHRGGVGGVAARRR